ncbi:hypothetical protein IFM89_030117 [Coptis chinensis]|uniref:Pseudouridine-5'-phosphate glycosidase n=1 Tax=Coptis chinensis TaxID=261450 RepID=A0A835I7C5_9MAGN|nr:hypothetical protein IFM89_030117 [Coptis chinensis]
MAPSSSALSRLANLQRHFQDDTTKDGTLSRRGNVKISPEVADALSRGDAVVALESTIISHGMPYPQNLKTAKEVEAIVRENGAVPATIAILDGVPCVGLNAEELERLANLGTRVQKTARRDIAHVNICNSAINIFYCRATNHSVSMCLAMDISSDLTELGRTPVSVISAGVKSILDIPRTLEYLETQGVTVAGYKTHEFPAFFTETSGFKVGKLSSFSNNPVYLNASNS